MTAPAVPPGSRLRQAASSAARGTVTWMPGADLLRAARQVPGWLMDGLLAAGFLAAMLAELVASAPEPEARQVLSVALSVVIAGGLALRQKVPVTAYLLGTSALVAGALWASRNTAAPYANLIGLYSVGLYARKARSWWGPVLAVAGVPAARPDRGHARSASITIRLDGPVLTIEARDDGRPALRTVAYRRDGPAAGRTAPAASRAHPP